MEFTNSSTSQHVTPKNSKRRSESNESSAKKQFKYDQFGTPQQLEFNEEATTEPRQNNNASNFLPCSKLERLIHTSKPKWRTQRLLNPKPDSQKLHGYLKYETYRKCL
jgi:hypothetical protein